MTRAKKTWKAPVTDIDWSRHLLKEPKERVREASVDEERRLLAAMRDDYTPAVRFAILTGCRRMEIVDLTWSRVDHRRHAHPAHRQYEVVQRLLGYEDITTTAKYAHAVIEDMRVAMNAANHTGNHTNVAEPNSNNLEEKKKSA